MALAEWNCHDGNTGKAMTSKQRLRKHGTNPSRNALGRIKSALSSELIMKHSPISYTQSQC
jgi:hypothetical protein